MAAGDRTAESVAADLAHHITSEGSGINGHHSSAFLGGDNARADFARSRARHLLVYLTNLYLQLHELAAQGVYRTNAPPADPVAIDIDGRVVMDYIRVPPTIQALTALLQVAPIALAEAILTKDGGLGEPVHPGWHRWLPFATQGTIFSTGFFLGLGTPIAVPLLFNAANYEANALTISGMLGAGVAGMVGGFLLSAWGAEAAAERVEEHIMESTERILAARQEKRTKARETRIANELRREMLGLELVIDGRVFERLGADRGKALLRSLWSGNSCADALTSRVEVTPSDDAPVDEVENAARAEFTPLRRR